MIILCCEFSLLWQAFEHREIDSLPTIGIWNSDLFSAFVFVSITLSIPTIVFHGSIEKCFAFALVSGI